MKIGRKEKEKPVFVPQTYQREIWVRFTPAQRLRRSWDLRRRIKNLKEVHDKKIFPSP